MKYCILSMIIGETTVVEWLVGCMCYNSHEGQHLLENEFNNKSNFNIYYNAFTLTNDMCSVHVALMNWLNMIKMVCYLMMVLIFLHKFRYV